MPSERLPVSIAQPAHPLGTIRPPGTVLAGRFRIIRSLGAGGMGSVYEIEHEITKHRRALKLLHRDIVQHPVAVERFLREASAAGRIANPHIIETFDAGTLDSGEPYVVMELLVGQTLADRLDPAFANGQLRQLPLTEIIGIVAQACDGAQAAHEAGIVHRDLKPENLFLVDRKAGHFWVKILDFGVSKFDLQNPSDVGVTSTGTPIGTPLYMAPEQLHGESHLDGRADVYSLGIILYECAAGVVPFTPKSIARPRAAYPRGRRSAAFDVASGPPAGVSRARSTGHGRRPKHRVQSAAELARALRELRASAHERALATTSGPCPLHAPTRWGGMWRRPC